MMLSQVTRLITCTSNRWKWIGCVSTPLWVIFQIWVPSAADEIGVTSSELGIPAESRISVGGFTYGYRMMFWRMGVAPGASRPRLAVIRPHSSNVAEFISSCRPFGWMATCNFAVPGAAALSRVLKPNRSAGWDPSAIRA
jgi:hypothetical protein